MSDRVAFLHRGEVLREGPTRALLREWAGEGYRLRLAEPKAEALAGALGPGWLPEAPDRLFFLGPWEALRAYLPRLDGEVLEVSRGTPSLESLPSSRPAPAPTGKRFPLTLPCRPDRVKAPRPRKTSIRTALLLSTACNHGLSCYPEPA